LAYLFFGKYTEFLGNTPIQRKIPREENDLKFGWGVCISEFYPKLFGFLPAVLPACLLAFRMCLPACRLLMSTY
jgi:hypothetical protein